jgi:hypothetical protein
LDIDENAIINVLRVGQLGIKNNVSELGDRSQHRNIQTMPKCLILVMKAEDSYMAGPSSDSLPDLVKIIHKEGTLHEMDCTI